MPQDGDENREITPYRGPHKEAALMRETRARLVDHCGGYLSRLTGRGAAFIPKRASVRVSPLLRLHSGVHVK